MGERLVASIELSLYVCVNLSLLFEYLQTLESLRILLVFDVCINIGAAFSYYLS